MILLQAVVQHGTGAAASSLKHALGGKTGTTNSFTDAWFIGFSPSITCGTWIGFDNPAQSLGDKETGAKAALPMWMDFMKVVIADKPNEQFAKPNAPKKQLDVPVAPEGEDQATPKPAKSDDSDSDDDSDKPAPPAPAPATVPPAADAVPNDEAAPKTVSATSAKPAPAVVAGPPKPVTPHL